MTIKDLISGFSLKRDEQALANFKTTPEIADLGSGDTSLKSSVLNNRTPITTSSDLFKNKAPRNMSTTNNAPEVRNSNSFFSTDLVINGSVESISNIEAMGTINGNVTSQNDVRILGKVKGNIFGRNIILEQSIIDGDVVAQGYVRIGDGTQIIGNITCENFETYGSVKGNLEVRQLATFNAGSDIVGDINACKVSINEDAMLTGNLKITRKVAGKSISTVTIEA